MTEAVDRVAPKPRWRRRWVGVVLIVLCCLAAVWSGLWLYASRYADAAFDQALAAEHDRGRDWDCSNRRISGYPLGLEVSCDTASFSGEISGRPFLGTTHAVHVVAHVYQPTHAVAEIEGPLELRSQDGTQTVEVNWKQFDISADGRPGSLDAITVVAQAPSVTVTTPDEGAMSVTATTARLRLAPSAGLPAEDDAFDVALDLAGACIPALDQWLRSSEPVDVSAEGTLSQARFAGPGSLAEKLEQWREAGGRLDIVQSSIVKGHSRIDATGSLDLDADHRPRGHIDTHASGLEPVLARLGVPSGAVALTGVLSGLFGTARAKAATDGTAVAAGIPLPLTLENGAISVGPIKMKYRLRPLY